jgi:hypothetical protein
MQSLSLSNTHTYSSFSEQSSSFMLIGSRHLRRSEKMNVHWFFLRSNMSNRTGDNYLWKQNCKKNLGNLVYDWHNLIKLQMLVNDFKVFISIEALAISDFSSWHFVWPMNWNLNKWPAFLTNKFTTTTTKWKRMNEKISFFESPCNKILRKWSSNLFSRYFAHVENLTMAEVQGERKKIQKC